LRKNVFIPLKMCGDFGFALHRDKFLEYTELEKLTCVPAQARIAGPNGLKRRNHP